LQLLIIASAEAAIHKIHCIVLEDCVFPERYFVIWELLCHCWATRVYRYGMHLHPYPRLAT